MNLSPDLRPNGQPVGKVDDPLEEVHLVRVPHDEGHVRGRERGRGQEGLAAHQLMAPVSEDGRDAQVSDERQVAVAHQQVHDGQAEVLESQSRLTTRALPRFRESRRREENGVG